MKSLDKVFKIIDFLKENKEMSLREISKELKLTKSNAHRILAELTKNKYTHKDMNKMYRLGYKFLEVSSYMYKDLDIRNVAKQYIDNLNEKTKETVHLAILLNDQVVYIDKRENKNSIRMYSQIGKTAPIYCTGLGKILLAFQPQDSINRILDNTSFCQYTKNTIIRKEDILKELTKIRKEGYALDREEHEKNLGCIAAPIWDRENNVVASISITIILYEKKFEEVLKYKDLLTEQCKKISKRLGYFENN